ncbi:MAG: 4-hydroxybenzoate 3-monooxygenase, partial [Geodermatophilaceae bacterium]|nr:4-hydroxybenzoate 3-monooxygenase [Geodermatophilaceae bacterium]
GTVETLREAGLGVRMDAEGMAHSGTELRFGGREHRIDFEALTGRRVLVYGQQEVVKDLIAARLHARGDLRFDVAGVALHDLDSDRPGISFGHQGREHQLTCDVVVGADGFHGVSRGHLPEPVIYERTYPFSWLGILAQAPPSSEELVYARHDDGFALHSMRSPTVTRMYLQVDPADGLDAWPDERIWATLHERLATEDGFTLTEGPLLDKGITPMRSWVTTPMQHGRLFLAGDSAHIVPPTGAKGMNLAVADVRTLSHALGGFYADGRTDLLAGYTDTALARVWRATHFSWWMTSMLHVDPHEDAFGRRLGLAQLESVVSSRAMSTALAENYTGLPYATGWSYR